ncbi:unnamed protein product [Cunninghamella blakesleeana]
MYGGYIYFQSSNNQANKDISIPYFGVIGRHKDIPLFHTVYITASISTFKPIPLNETIDYRSYSNLTIINILDMGTRYLVKVVNKETKKLIGYLEPPQYHVGRSVIQVPFEAFTFNGTYIPSLFSSFKERIPIPNGIYNIVYKALRIFGDINDPKDFDSWVSNDIIIKNN